MKRIAFIPTVYKRLENVLTDRHAIFFKLIEEKLGFERIFCDSITEMPPDLEMALVFTNLHGKRLMVDMLKFPKKTKVIMYFTGSHQFPHANNNIIDALKRCDVVLCGERQAFEERWPQFMGKFVFFPSCFAPHERYADLEYNDKPIMKCLFSGCNSAKHYPVRHYLKDQVFRDSGLQKIVDIIRHPRWDTEPWPLNKWELKVPMGNAYAECLNRYFCSVATSSTVNYAVAKYFEIPAAGALLLANKISDAKRVGLVAGEHYVPVTKDNIIPQIKDCLENPGKYEGIRRNGMEYVRENHSMNNRIEQFKEILEKTE